MELKWQAPYPMDTETMFTPGSHTRFWIPGVHVKKLHPDAIIPTRGTTMSAGLDLYSLEEFTLLSSPDARLVKTGIAIDMTRMSTQMVGLIFPRSGLGHKQGITLGNGTGVIDQDYHGEIMVSLWNRGNIPYIIKKGDRIAQLVFMPIFVPPFIEVDDFVMTTERGAGGFGSTGG